MDTTSDILVPEMPWLKKKEIDFINSCYRRFYANHKFELRDVIEDCLSNGQLTLRQAVWDLERNIADLVGTKYCATVNSGTDALFLSLKALGIGEGDEVITCSNTFIATIQAIVNCGATPVLIDVKEDELLDVEQLEAVVTPKTKAIIPVQYTGAICDMEKILEIATKYNLYVVDDACQALGAKGAGTFGILNCFSFNTAKLMGGMLDGGCVTTNDKKLYDEICLLRNHYNVHQLSVDRNDYPQPEEMKWAWKSRLANINAAFINVKLKRIKDIVEKRAEIAKKYNEAFKELPLQLPHDQEGRVWQEYHLRVQDRAKFKDYLKEKGIETLVRDEVPNHKMKGLGLEHFNLPITEQLAREVIRLPLHEWLTNEEVEKIMATVKEFYDRK